MSFCCCLSRKRSPANPSPMPEGGDGLRGVEFSPRTSYASSIAPPMPEGGDGLRGVEFSPRTSYASSIAPPMPGGGDGPHGVEFSPRTSYASSEAFSLTGTSGVDVDNPELAGYYAPEGPAAQSIPSAAQELRGFYEPQPMVSAPVRNLPHKTSYA
ncbi:hypothetical protein BX600DRAFT_434463 [Xylariales sp. PMI_506]|nr:hypothetical protein BX600DRAFT_434463 [Xylariales sp. PMI_506]